MTNHANEKEGNGTWIGGVFCGRKITEHLYAEEVANRRYLIRVHESFPRRLGEVFGGNGHFQACRMNGDHVGVATTLAKAAKILSC